MTGEDPAAQQLLWLLLAGDLLFLSLHVIFLRGHFSDTYFSIEQDRGFGEVFQYLKHYWTFLTFGLTAALRKEPHYGAWSILFGYLLVDDWFSLHERAGLEIVSRLPLPVPYDLGELLFMGLIGSLFGPVLLWSYSRASAAARAAGRRMACLLAALVFFGAGVDILHQLSHGTILYNLVGTVEDGGEMVVMSLICTYAISLRRVNILKMSRDGVLKAER